MNEDNREQITVTLKLPKEAMELFKFEALALFREDYPDYTDQQMLDEEASKIVMQSLWDRVYGSTEPPKDSIDRDDVPF